MPPHVQLAQGMVLEQRPLYWVGVGVDRPRRLAFVRQVDRDVITRRHLDGRPRNRAIVRDRLVNCSGAHLPRNVFGDRQVERPRDACRTGRRSRLRSRPRNDTRRRLRQPWGRDAGIHGARTGRERQSLTLRRLVLARRYALRGVDGAAVPAGNAELVKPPKFAGAGGFTAGFAAGRGICFAAAGPPPSSAAKADPYCPRGAIAAPGVARPFAAFHKFPPICPR